MKSERGITLLSLIVYIILLCIAVAMLSTLSNLFFSNTSYLTENSKNIAEYNKFAMYFIDDVKKYKTCEVTNTQVIFLSNKRNEEDGMVVYTFTKEPDNSIYRNKVKICKNINFCRFSKKEEQVSNTKKTIIQVYMLITNNNKAFETNNEFVLKYW